MSRSRKKNPIIKCAGDKTLKTAYNRKFRRKKELDFPSGNAYRKANESWEISDFRVGYYHGEELPYEDRSYLRK